ncbi:hypothetical protein PRZ48_011430 [Zasmidium cellare]|uniref:F-box domain-containing protein n=1 Tax=Zasmidium cellare TaxID=395010 RepID=A0ABR0E6D1_ZASCE|nr:hypothetical protein PRZ48_011430 [Zasmidium cellare]
MPNIPEEILQQIFSYLQPELSDEYWRGCSLENRPKYTTLAAICRASKTCHRLATPILYHTIEIYGPNNYRQMHDKLDLSGLPANIKPLLRTLMSNSSLAVEVKEIKIEQFEICPPYALESKKNKEESARKAFEMFHGNWLCNDDTAKPVDQSLRPRFPLDVFAPGTLKEEDQDRASVVVRELGLSDGLQLHLEEAIATGLEDGEVAIVLALCSNLEHLELPALFGLRMSLVVAVAEELIDHLAIDEDLDAWQPQPPFSKLRELIFRNEVAPHLDFCTQIDYVGLIRAPALETLKGYGLCVASILGQFAPPDCSNLTKLELDHGIVNEWGLDQFLKAFPFLRELSWLSIGGSDVLDVHPEETSACLRDYGHNLEKLILNPEFVGFAPMGPINTLHKLKHFATTKTMLFGEVDYRTGDRWDVEMDAEPPQLVDVLPTCLEMLEILHTEPEHYIHEVGDEENLRREDWHQIDVEQVSRLIADPRFGALKTIRLHREFPFNGDLTALGWEEAKTEDFLVLKRSGW